MLVFEQLYPSAASEIQRFCRVIIFEGIRVPVFLWLNANWAAYYCKVKLLPEDGAYHVPFWDVSVCRQGVPTVFHMLILMYSN